MSCPFVEVIMGPTSHSILLSSSPSVLDLASCERSADRTTPSWTTTVGDEKEGLCRLTGLSDRHRNFPESASRAIRSFWFWKKMRGWQ